MKILFATTVYNGVEGYLNKFMNSLEYQSYKNFDLLLVNDNLDYNLLQDILGKYSMKIDILNTNNKFSFPILRKIILDYSLENSYDLLILGDADDYFHQNRIEYILSQFDNDFHFFYHDLYIGNQNNSFFKDKLPQYIDSYENVKEYNFLGLTNTAINLNKSKYLLNNLKVYDVIAFDWYLFTFMLLNDCKGKLVKDAKTYYRIYSSNTAGNTSTLTLKSLKTGIDVKQKHYYYLSLLRNEYKTDLNKVLTLKSKINNELFEEKYIQIINNYYSNCTFWWENIKTLDKLEGLL